MSTEFGFEEDIGGPEDDGQASSDGKMAGLPDVPPRPPVRYDQSWLTSLMRPFLIILMIACLDIALGAVVARFADDLPPGFATGLVVIAIFGAILGVTTTSVLAQPSQRANRRAATRVAELALLLAIVRLYVWVAGSGVPSLQTLLETPLTSLLDMQFIVCAAIVTISWLLGAEMAGDLSRLALTAGEIRMFERRSDRGADSMRGSGIDRRDVLDSFIMRWVVLGFALILVAVVVRRDVSAENFYGVFRQDVEPAVMIAIILFFVAGLLLISHGQLALLRSRWTLEQTPSDGSVSRRWPILVLSVIGAIAVTAAFLPLGGTFLLAAVLSAIVGGALWLLMELQNLVLLAFFWLTSLFGGGPETQPILQLPETVTVAQDLPRAAPLAPVWLSGSLFWVAIVALVGYAAWVYLHDRGAGFAWLTWLWNALRRRADDARSVLRRRSKEVAAALGDASGRGRRWSLLEWWQGGPKGPDEEVRYLYLMTLEQADEAGIGRSPSETPLHFAPRLEAAVSEEPEAVSFAEELTDAFVEVRYAQRPMTRERAAALRERWEALRRALRRQEED